MFEDVAEILVAAEPSLRELELDGHLALRATLRDNTKSLVLRVEAPTSTGPLTLIVKVYREKPEETLARELALLEFLRTSRLTARVHGQVLGRAIVVMEDLGDNSDELTLAFALGALHRLETSAEGPLPKCMHRSTIPALRDLPDLVRTEMESVGLQVSDAFENDAREVLRQLDDPSATAVIHGDAYPGNSRRRNGMGYLIDFGDAGLGHPGVDVSCLVAGFPTSRDFNPPDIEMLESMLDAYRSARSVSLASVERDITVGCGYWVLRILSGRFLNPKKVLAHPRVRAGYGPRLAYILKMCAPRIGPYLSLQVAAHELQRLVESRLTETTGL